MIPRKTYLVEYLVEKFFLGGVFPLFGNFAKKRVF
jgi:hypothetical protein